MMNIKLLLHKLSNIISENIKKNSKGQGLILKNVISYKKLMNKKKTMKVLLLKDILQEIESALHNYLNSRISSYTKIVKPLLEAKLKIFLHFMIYQFLQKYKKE